MGAMLTVTDPAIFFSVYLLKHAFDSGVDERLQVLRQVDAFIDSYHLQPYVAEKRPYRRAADIDLLSSTTSPPSFKILLQCHSECLKTPTSTYYECLAYFYHDALILQFMITKFKDWKGSFVEGWRELTGSVLSCFHDKALAAAQRATLGASVVYWAIADSHPE